ncbi:metal-dependent hydrolase [Flavisolibacter nicotianae]|uniref:metal-dependent hydrolase n=1 Tax=Flavisolibacter nicotianae TaxID=2364882 RepID=UPI000EABF3BF|nr:metal-dependent hydrolase [Flavisolibacter nicotianae]
MFIGHYAVGFAAKKLQAKPSLGTYFLAAQFLDLLWPTLLMLKVEKAAISPGGPVPLSFTHYPVSHSLLAVLGWAVLFGLLYFLVKKNRGAAIMVGCCVVSHWLLDLVVHLPDLPLYPGGNDFYGLGLWKVKTIELLVELLLFAAGVLFYYRATKAKNKTGVYALGALVIFLLVVHLVNAFGPPPTDITAVAWAGQLQWLIVLWGYWVDRNRVAKAGNAPIETAQFTSGQVVAS